MLYVWFSSPTCIAIEICETVVRQLLLNWYCFLPWTTPFFTIQLFVATVLPYVTEKGQGIQIISFSSGNGPYLTTVKFKTHEMQHDVERCFDVDYVTM